MAAKYYLATDEGHRVEVSESYFDSVQHLYDESNISATGDSYGNEEIVLYVDEDDMP